MFNSDHCNSEITVQEINRFQNGQLKNDFLFPKLLTNFFGCPLTVSAQIYEPLLTFEGDIKNETHLVDMQRLGGIEGEILKLVAEALNFKIHMRFSEELSEINLRSNSTGCFKDLEQEIALIAIGGLSSNLVNNSKFTKSFVYHTTPYKFAVRSNIFFGPIKQLINPLNKTTWIILLIFLAILITLIQVIVHLKTSKIRSFIFGVGNKHPAFNLITTFLGYSLTNRALPQRNFARFLLVSWLFMVLAIRNGYQGKMFDSLRLAKRMPVPKTITELIAKDYTLLNPVYTSFYPRNKTSIYCNSTSLLQQIQSSEQLLAAATILESLAHYNFQNSNSSSLSPVDETIYSYQCVMYFNKYSVLRESFERNLKLFTNSGITSHIAKKHSRVYYQDKSTSSQDIGVITSRNLRGLYYIYSIMCQISILIFILELLTKKSENLKRLMDWLN
ncbi:uncharacterized protein LOC135961346 [Calliphora vicina]|uniref:uncharacterized protein LOC135961346 n=1 Tax=Calliphora vicina TaxID=7373 RepID=UPI00325AEACC